MKRHLGTVLTVLTLTSGCSLITGVDGPRKTPSRILFIGNSLTHGNSLPLLVQAMADSAQMFPRLTIGTEIAGGTSLADHWLGNAPAAIDSGWDVVVLQQGPTSRAVHRVELRMMTARFAERIRKMGGEPALFMVWPDAQHATDFPNVSKSYRLAAEDVNAYLFPAGEAWLEAWRRNHSMPLYGDDGFHPSVYGTYLAALTIFGMAYDRSVVGLPSRFRLSDMRSIWINPLDARVLQEAADEANRRHGRRPR